MPNELVVNERTKQALHEQLQSNSHALLLVGPNGIGKASLALLFAALRNNSDIEQVLDSAYVRYLKAGDTKHIPIEAVRGIEHFLSRRIPADKQRTIIIENAELLTIDAQNALLKMLEEPPADTIFVLTATSETAVLPTIRSRVTILKVIRPSQTHVKEHFVAAGYEHKAIQRAELMSGGLPGLMHALLTANHEHPLVEAATQARDIMQKTSFERLALVDALAKNRQLSLDTLYVLQQMAHVSLASGNTNKIWPVVLREAYDASVLLQQSAQPKLVLTNLMLKLAV